MKNVFIVSASLVFLVVGCGGEQDTDIKTCKDLVPCEVIVNDFVEFDKGGTYALYKISGRGKVVTTIVTMPDDKDKGKIKYYKLKRPRLERKSVTFAKTDIYKQDRSVFTTLKEDDMNHFELRKEAVECIIKTIEENEEVVEMAMRTTESTLKGFYGQKYECQIEWVDK